MQKHAVLSDAVLNPIRAAVDMQVSVHFGSVPLS